MRGKAVGGGLLLAIGAAMVLTAIGLFGFAIVKGLDESWDMEDARGVCLHDRACDYARFDALYREDHPSQSLNLMGAGLSCLVLSAIPLVSGFTLFPDDLLPRGLGIGDSGGPL